MEIVVPREEFLASYRDAMRETWASTVERYILHDPDRFDDWKTTIFQSFEDARAGRNLPPGWLPSETRWIVDGGEYVGTVDVRFRLPRAMKLYGGHFGIVVRPSRRGGFYSVRGIRWAIAECFRRGDVPALATVRETNVACRKTLDRIAWTKRDSIETEIYGERSRVWRYWFFPDDFPNPEIPRDALPESTAARDEAPFPRSPRF